MVSTGNLEFEHKADELFFESETRQNIHVKWVKEENRTFSIYPSLPVPDNGTFTVGEEKTWLELARFVEDDLRWLLSLDHHKFWSHMIYSKEARELLVSFLRESPPYYVKNNLLVDGEMKNVFRDIERLVFLVFLRLSTEEESERCFIKNLGDVLYDNYLFTVPVMLDICLIYGINQSDLVKKMIGRVITLAPRFLNDFQEIVPHFLQVLSLVKEKFFVERVPKLNDKKELRPKEMRDLILYLHDSVATVEAFLNLYPSGGKLLCGCEFINEMVSFYSNGLPKVHEAWERSEGATADPLPVSELIEKTRVDFLKIVKAAFDCVASQARKNPTKREDLVDDYLTMMMELLSESTFLSDYNYLYSIEFEIESVTQDCANVDTMKMDHILEGVRFAGKNESQKKREACGSNDWRAAKRLDESEPVLAVKLKSLVTEVRDIFPHLEERFVEECLKRYDYSTEKVITGILESSLPGNLQELSWTSERVPAAKVKGLQGLQCGGAASSIGSKSNIEPETTGMIEFKGKHKSKYENLTEMLQDRTEIGEFKDRYAQLILLMDETYDDEYDDTYDENVDVSVRDADESEKERRPFVIPRVLRPAVENGASESEADDDDDEDDVVVDDAEERKDNKDCFVANPAELRERKEQKRLEKIKRDVVGRGRGQGQSKQVLSNREFKGAHKSSVGNHNRKKQASRKKNQGMIPS